MPGNATKSWLVGGWATPLQEMKVNWDDEIPNIRENAKNVNQTPNQMGVLEENDRKTNHQTQGLGLMYLLLGICCSNHLKKYLLNFFSPQ